MESEPRRDDGGKYKEPNLSSLVEIELNDDDDLNLYILTLLMVCSTNTRKSTTRRIGHFLRAMLTYLRQSLTFI